MPCRAQPVPPTFQPEVSAGAVYWAAHQRHREVFVGWRRHARSGPAHHARRFSIASRRSSHGTGCSTTAPLIQMGRTTSISLCRVTSLRARGFRQPRSFAQLGATAHCAGERTCDRCFQCVRRGRSHAGEWPDAAFHRPAGDGANEWTPRIRRSVMTYGSARLSMHARF